MAPRKITQPVVSQSKVPAGAIRQNVTHIPAIYNAQALIQDVRQDYDFGSVVADRKDFPRGSGEAIISALTRNHPTITKMVRAAVRTNGLAARPADVTATMVIGQGMTPVCHDEALMTLYRKWTKRAGAEAMGDFRFVQEQAWREFFNTGEVFVYLRYRDAVRGVPLPVGLQLQLLPTEMVPVEVPFISAQNVRGGQVIDSRGETTHYYIYKTHPGDRASLVAPASKEIVKVSANLILHVMRQTEPGALRGESALLRALIEIHDLKRFVSAELLRKVLSSKIAYVVQIPDLTEEEKERLADVFFDPATGQYVNSDGQVVEPPKKPSVDVPDDGSVVMLPPGATMSQLAPPEIGNSFSPFLRQVALQLAAALNIPVEFLLLDMAGVQDRIYKGISHQFERQVEMWRADFAAMFLNPVWNTFVRLAVESGKWTPPEGTTLDDWLDADWIGQPFPNLHRSQEVASWKEEVDSGFATKSDIIRRQGDRPERVRQERLADLTADIQSGLADVPASWTDKDMSERLGWDTKRIADYRARTVAAAPPAFQRFG